MPKASTAPEIEYPESDGKPMAESDTHIDLVIDLRTRLKAWFADEPNVYVAGNLFVYYEDGDPHQVLAPDGFVVFGVPNRRRRVFKTWIEGRFPSVVFEFTSQSTDHEDVTHKFNIYQDEWKVQEYFLFDPEEEYMEPPLVGYRMVRGELKPIKPTKGELVSKVLGLSISRDGNRLILRDAATGEKVLTPDEARAAKAEKKAAREKSAREEAEAEVARLTAELNALKRKPTK